MKMFRVLIYIAGFIVLSNNTGYYAQTLLDGAESVAFDTLNNRYLVSSLNTSKIISIDLQGNQTVFKEGITAFGNCIKDNVFYVSGGTHVRGLDVNTAEIIFDVNISGAQQLDGVTTDNNGNLYVVETLRNQIYKINLNDRSVSQFASAGTGKYPQDIIFDKYNNRLLLVFWHANSSVLSIDAVTGEADTAVTTETGFFDGISTDNEGNFYLASHDGDGKVIMYDNYFENPPAVISTGYNEPAGLDVNLRDNILAIPIFAADRVDFIQLPAVYINLDVETSEPRGRIPHTVNFTSIISSSSPIDSWEWDFDSDGIIDSYEENPSRTFNEPGVYTVTLNAGMDTLVREVVLANYVHAFNENTAIELGGETGNALIEAAPELALGEEWTFSAWIKPYALGRSMVFYKNVLQVSTNGNPSSSTNANSLVVSISKEEGGLVSFSTADSTVILDDWQHIAVTYDYNNQKFGIYINGKQIINKDGDPGLFESVLKNNIEENIIIGNSRFGSRTFDGAIDNVELWSIYMNESEIHDLMETSRNGDEIGLTAIWNMNEGTGEQIHDMTSNNNNGKLENVLFTPGVDLSLYTSVEGRNSNFINLPSDFELYQNYPNPFNPETTIEFALEKDSQISLNVYNIRGELVKTLLSADYMTGSQRVKWDGTDNSGARVVSGVYFYSIGNGSTTISRKMILLK